jgi:peptidoglycan/LPS O-acetylase OafA/YrhL
MTNQREQVSSGYPLFDWLRFILASAVVLSHTHLGLWANAGNFSVCVFFALSGWLIGGILLRTPVRELPRFYFNRSIRIWIPYLVAVVALYLFAAVRDSQGSRYFQFLFYDVTFTHYWFIPKIPEVIRMMPLNGTGAHFWSISVEEQFYLISPLILIFLPGGRNPVLWLVLSAVALYVDYHYACIMLGVFAAMLNSKFGEWHKTPALQFTMGITLLLVAYFILSRDDYYPMGAPLAALLIVLLCSRVGIRTETGKFLGGVSYPLYLNHWIGLFAANALHKLLGLSQSMWNAAGYGLAIVVGVVAYLAVDRNVLKFRQTHYSDRAGMTLTVVAYGLLIAGLLGQGLILDALGSSRP